MNRFRYILVASCLFSAFCMHAQPQWRFGLEYNEIGNWSLPHHEQLLTKLEQLGTRGAINVNGVGSWSSMQSGPAAQINFRESDSIVALFQRHNFELSWYLRCDATWAFPSKSIPLFQTAAPDPQFEQQWKNYVRAIVERYDGDGVNDLPGLQRPIRFFIMIGEVKFGRAGTGDDEVGPFWADNFDNLIRLHEITYAALREADPTGASKLVSSGALLWDLFADFPGYPEFYPSDTSHVIHQRLRWNNYRGAKYTGGMDSLKKMLIAFGQPSPKRCDYIGWHPHFNWRVIDQEFKFIRAFAGQTPIYIDDMWCNLFAVGYALGALIPGNAIFTASKFLPRDTKWEKAINGDFPNQLFTTIDPYGELFQKLNAGDSTVTKWYYLTGAHRLVKSIASAFGEGAERVSFSQTNDILRGTEVGWLNLLGTRQETFGEKPQFFSMKLLIEKLRDFTSSEEMNVSVNPRTRVYKFERPRGPLYIAWSETGDAPPNLDYTIATGEMVSFTIESDSGIITRPVTSMSRTEPFTQKSFFSQKRCSLQLGYEPLFIEPVMKSTSVERMPDVSPHNVKLTNFPNPATDATTLIFELVFREHVTIDLFDMLGRKVRTVTNAELPSGVQTIPLNTANLPSGLYRCLLTTTQNRAQRMVVVRK